MQRIQAPRQGSHKLAARPREQPRNAELNRNGECACRAGGHESVLETFAYTININRYLLPPDGLPTPVSARILTATMVAAGVYYIHTSSKYFYMIISKKRS
jgi:hypothetical protein